MIVEGDELKMTCISRYGTYEFIVMSLELTNAPATFSSFMNKIFYYYLDKFVVVYPDNIVVYKNRMDEHVGHLRMVFQVMKDN